MRPLLPLLLLCGTFLLGCQPNKAPEPPGPYNPPKPKVEAPAAPLMNAQRQALEKARGLEQTLQEADARQHAEIERQR